MMPPRPRRLFVHVEEPSMAAVMSALLPKLPGANTPAYRVIGHGSKRDLLKNLGLRLSGYARGLQHQDIRVLVLVDRDNDDCRKLKQRLEAAAHGAGLATKSTPDAAGCFCVVNRIVIEELEAWFFGDLPALRAAYPGVPARLDRKAAFRDPDAIGGGTWEALFRVLKGAGHYVGMARMPKIEVARTVAAHMQPDRNRSASFRQFQTGLAALIAH